MDRDELLDPLLERTSRARGSGVPQPGCLDAEALAAWQDGGLSPAERALAEAHAADCDRCLATLAAMARTSPPGAQQPASRWFPLRWLIPAASAAVALMAWVLVHEPESARSLDEAQVASRGVPAGPPPIVPAEPRQLPESAAPAEQSAKVAVQPPAPTRSTAPHRADDARARTVEDAIASVPQAPSLAEAAKPAPSAELRRSEAAADSTPSQRFESAPPPAPAAPVAAPAAAPAEAATGALAEGVRLVKRVSAPLVIVSPDPNARWRVLGTSVERSLDGGRTWRAQPTGESALPVAGAAPAANVCWLVGRGGMVLRSTDGETWQSVNVPDPSLDLVSVTARDARIATVGTADHRRYHTTDGGLTWTPQENRRAPF